MSNPTILVTGGTGFAGSHLIQALLAAGHDDIWSTTFSPPDQSVQFLPEDRYVSIDLTDAGKTADLIARIHPDWIFHLASFAYVGKSFEKAHDLLSNNISLQLSILEGVRVYAPTCRVLTIGSAEEYGVIDPGIDRINEDVALNPVNPYAVSKVTQDLLAGSYAMSYGLSVIRARPFNHIGIRQTGDFAIPAFVTQIVAIERGLSDVLSVGNLDGVRDFTSVQDMVKAYIVLMESGVPGEVYNIGSGKGVSMHEVVDMLCSLSTTQIRVQREESRLRPLDVPRLVADNTKVTSLGWKPEIPIKVELQNILGEWRKKTQR